MCEREKKVFNTTEIDFNYFKSRCDYWITKFGLTEWSVSYSHVETVGELAFCRFDFGQLFVEIFLAKDWDEEVSPGRLDYVSLHEVLEILLSVYDESARDRYTNEESLQRNRHGVINRVLNAILSIPASHPTPIH